jgi:hypothetical protein
MAASANAGSSLRREGGMEGDESTGRKKK